ncbi:MAG: hypothetical protein AB7D28_06595 [Candidatus Berkiella sp.]
MPVNQKMNEVNDYLPLVSREEAHVSEQMDFFNLYFNPSAETATPFDSKGSIRRFAPLRNNLATNYMLLKRQQQEATLHISFDRL